MKKLSQLIFSLILFLGFTQAVNAASATIGVTTSSNQVVVGKSVNVTVTISSSVVLGSWEYVLNYDTSMFTMASSSADQHVVGYGDGSNKSVTYRYTFTAKKSGTGKFYVNASSVADWDTVSYMTVNNGSRTVKVITQQQLEATYSKNNNLKSLSIDGFDLEPVFDKNTLEYKVTVPYDTTNIKINALKEDSTASVSGTGEHEVSLGINKFEIIVTAQNGSEKKYIVNVTVEDLDPIEVEVNGKKYTVVRQAEVLQSPHTYTATTTFIDGEEVPALYCELVDNTLVGLKDEAGNISLFSYDDETNTYVIYQEVKFSSMTIVPREYAKELSGYNKTEIDINGVKFKAFVREENDNFYIIYGMNTETGKTQLYTYDKLENTIQRYNDIQNNDGISKTYLIVMALFGGGLVLSMLIIIMLLSSKGSGNYSNKEVKNIFNDSVWDDKKKLTKKEKKAQLKAERQAMKEAERELKKSSKIKTDIRLEDVALDEKVLNSESNDEEEMYLLFDDKKKKKK